MPELPQSGQLASPFAGFAYGQKEKSFSSSQGSRLRHLFFFFYPESKRNSKVTGSRAWLRARPDCNRHGTRFVAPRLQLKWLQFSTVGLMIMIGEEWRPNLPVETVWSTSPVCLCTTEAGGVGVYWATLWFVEVQTDGGGNWARQVLNLHDGCCPWHNCSDLPAWLPGQVDIV